MTANNDCYANITNVVQDFMFVEITSSPLLNKTFEYKIISQDETLIRKGRFEGPIVQLRLSLINEGKYFFQLYLNGEQLQHTGFEKKEGFGEFMLHMKEE